jgi:gluconokinase
VHDYLRSVGPLAIIVMGVSGCGKSTLGTALAGALDCPFLEGDRFHAPESIAKMRA